MAEPLCPRASAEVKRGVAFWLRSASPRCNDCATAGEKVRRGSAPLLAALAVAGVGSRSPLAVRWLPLHCASRQTFNALERRHASLKIESQLSMVRVDGGDNQLAFTKGCKVAK
eukprot:scaffold15130_cov63-Phaeocystis_antarctica.AAC.4